MNSCLKKIHVLGADGFRRNRVCLNQRCASRVSDAPTITPFVFLDLPVGLRQTVSVLAWKTIKENRSPVWCQNTCNSISTKPNLPQRKIKPIWGRAFPSSFCCLWSSPSIFKRSREIRWVQWLVQNKNQQEDDPVLLVFGPLSCRSLCLFIYCLYVWCHVNLYLLHVHTWQLFLCDSQDLNQPGDWADDL